VAISGAASARLAGELADLVIAVQPDASLLQSFREAGGGSKPSYGQLPVSYDTDERKAAARAHGEFRWFAGGWKVNAELPGTAAFAAASQSVTEEEVAAQIPCGPDVDRHLSAIREFRDAGFTHLALVQVGNDRQPDFIEWAATELLPRARAL
jgi:G6PDH family F420-dependent oxidoreductase